MRKAYLLLLTAVILILFSGSWVLSKEVVGSVSPVLATGVRLLFTTTVLWLWVFCSEGRRGSFHLRRGRAVRFAVLSIFGFSAYFISTFEALKDLKASELTMLLSSIPGFTYVLGVLFGVLSFSWLRFFGVLVVTLGGVMFNVSPGASFGGVQGIAFAFLGALSYSVYGLLSRVWLERDSIVVSVAWITLMSFVSFIPFVLAHHDSLMGLAMDDVVKLFVLGGLLSAPVYVLYQKVLSVGEVVYANSVGLLAPCVVVASEWALGEDVLMDGGRLIWMMVTMLGIFLLYVDASGLFDRVFRGGRGGTDPCSLMVALLVERGG